ncbi:MAG: cytochrome c biogenesis protein ResB, partial [Coriobacteriia bacterium]|nr:cytochrome c biogenesis protein ResB [Coriobacteriia bacterium]
MRFLGSPRLAIGLLLLLGAWTIAASFIPQNTASADAVAAWRAANPGLLQVVDTLGLHDAFASIPYVALGVFLALCTAVCAWQRTGVARRRARTLRDATAGPGVVGASSPDLDIPLGSSLGEERALQVAADTLRHLGIPAGRRGESLVSVSPWWSVWGTAVFHWALVVIIVTIALAGLVRAEGQMGVAVGQSRPDQPESYGQLTAGPWYRWGSVTRFIRVDDFDLDYQAGGVSRGPTPTVSVLDGDGEVLASRIVYPNHILRHGALSIYPVDYGLSAAIVMLDATGSEIGRAVQLLDFDGMSPDGTSPVSEIGLYGSDGQVLNRLIVSVPLDSVEEGFLGRVPEVRRARIVVLGLDGSLVLDEVIEPGQRVGLPAGGALELLGVDYYARLQLVDDPSIPLLYAAGVIAM